MGPIGLEDPQYVAKQSTIFFLEENYNLLVDINPYLQAEFTRVVQSKAEEVIRAYKDEKIQEGTLPKYINRRSRTITENKSTKFSNEKTL